MRSVVLGILAATVMTAAATGCRSLSPGRESASLPPVLSQGAAGISEAEISEARSLYVAKCAKCHRFYPPADYSEGDWKLWMIKMSRKSKLKAEQEELLSRYLGVFRLVEPPNKAGRPNNSQGAQRKETGLSR